MYLVFLDVTKAYDKAWLKAIMYIMHKQGLIDNNWRLILKMNENLKARITQPKMETQTKSTSWTA